MSSNPKGMGLYLRALNTKPAVLNKHIDDMLKAGIKWAAVGAMWHEKGKVRWINNPTAIVKIVGALNEAGIAPYTWGYPWYSTVQQFVKDVENSCLIFKDSTGKNVTRGFLVDPELGLRKHPTEAKRLFQGLRELTRNIRREGNSFTVGFTSYGTIVPDFPWNAFAVPGIIDPTRECDYGSNQVYESTPAQIVASTDAYARLGFNEVIPSFGLYKTLIDPITKKKTYRSKTPAELKAHFHAFVLCKTKINAMIGWAENFMKPNLIPVIAEYSELLDRGIFSLKKPV